MSVDIGHTEDIDRTAQNHEYGAAFWAGTVMGWAIIVYGAVLLVGDDEAEWFNTIRLVAIGIVAHDIVWLAASIGTGWALSRVLGRKVPHWITWAGWTSAIIIALWLPLARGYGDRLNNDTILPRNYAASILILLPLIWAAAAIWGLFSARRDDPEAPSPEPAL
jgi:hypothetical protein